MSESQQAEKANDDEEQSQMTKDEFYDRIALEGLTLEGDFFMPKGTGRQRRYHRYDPGLVKGYDAVRDDDGDIVAQEVANHEEAQIEQVKKSHIDDVVLPKVQDGFGAFGQMRAESTRNEGGSSGSSGSSGNSEPEYEPMDDDEVLETIRQNYDEHGFFGETDDGEAKVVSLAHPDARLMGYITGSHVGALPGEGLNTVDDYRNAVYQALGADLSDTDDDAEPIVDFDTPDDVPIMTDDMMETFKESGSSLTEEQKERIGKQVERRWEDGEYDHLRKPESDEDEEATDEGADGGDDDTEDDDEQGAQDEDEGDDE